MCSPIKNICFAPGCALYLYKPYLIHKIMEFLQEEFDTVTEMEICCRNQPGLSPDKTTVSACPGCDRRFRENYADPVSTSLWEILLDSHTFRFPDYSGQRMSIIDACPARDQNRIHNAIRRLLERMNITLVEPARTRDKGICCGDSLWGETSVAVIKKAMQKRASQMPMDDVVVYCVSCSKSLFIGGKRPHYIVDLLFGEETLPGTIEPEAWHRELDEFIASH